MEIEAGGLFDPIHKLVAINVVDGAHKLCTILVDMVESYGVGVGRHEAHGHKVDLVLATGLETKTKRIRRREEVGHSKESIQTARTAKLLKDRVGDVKIRCGVHVVLLYQKVERI